MKKLLISFLAGISLWFLLGAVAQNVPLYVHNDATIAAPTQFLSRVFIAGAGITITDRRTNLIIAASGGGGATVAFVYQVGDNGTNFTYLIGANGTNFTYQIGANLTNFTYQIGANGTNFAYLIGANGTNYANSIFLSLSNLVVSLTSGILTNAYGGTNINIRSQGGTNYFDFTGSSGGGGSGTGGTNFALMNWTNYGTIDYWTNAINEVGYSGSYGGYNVTNVISFTNGYIQWLEITNNNIWFETTNRNSVVGHREIEVWLVPKHFWIATNRNINLNTSWRNISGGVTSLLLSNKIAILRLRCVGGGGENTVFSTLDLEL